MGFILSAFFWSYTLFQIPSGWLAGRLGPAFCAPYRTRHQGWHTPLHKPAGRVVAKAEVLAGPFFLL
jgi:MFS family permease